MDFEEAVTHVLDQGQAEAVGGVSDGGMAANEAIQALVALGYTSTEAVKAVKKVEITADMTVEDILRAGLKNL